MEQLSFSQLNVIDLVDFLATIGIQPKKRKGHHYYYLSPLAGHPVNKPTFIVNRHLNNWRETTSKDAGSLSDLAVRLYNCTIGELTSILRAALPLVPQILTTQDNGEPDPVTVEQTHPIRSGYLERYLWERRIPLHVARHYCLEASYKRRGNLYLALAFPCDTGGFELFDRTHHYRVPPCGPTHIRYQSQSVAIFRHVIDLLTYVTLFAGPIRDLPDLLILNAAVPFPVVQSMIHPYAEKHLFLPNDASGILFSRLAMRELRNCYDQRLLYQGYAGLNDWICHLGTSPGAITVPSQINAQQPRSIPSSSSQEA